VADEGHNSTKIYATEIGLNGRNLVPEEMLEVLGQLPLKAEEHERLRMATPHAVEGSHLIGNERLRPKQLSYSTRRFCPHCLGDAPYHRIQWDVTVASHCPIHGTRLVGEVGGKKLKWWWPHFDVSPNGDFLIDRSSAAPARPLPFHEMLRTRLELGRREDGPTSTYDLCDLIETSLFFCPFVKDGQPIHPNANPKPDIEGGFALVAASQEDRVAWFNAWYGAVAPAEVRSRGLRASSMGATILSSNVVSRETNPLWKELELAQYEGFSLVGTIGRKFTNYLPAKSGRTLSQAAEELNLPVKGLRKFIKTMHLLPDAQWNRDAHNIDDETFDKLKALIADLISLPQTSEITGISATEFRRLAAAGHIREVMHMPIGGKTGPRYFASDVRGLIERFRAISAQPKQPGMQSLPTFCRARKLNIGDVLLTIMAGKQPPSGVDLSKTGLRALYLGSRAER
jgi:hypothetical protein